MHNEICSNFETCDGAYKEIKILTHLLYNNLVSPIFSTRFEIYTVHHALKNISAIVCASYKDIFVTSLIEKYYIFVRCLQDIEKIRSLPHGFTRFFNIINPADLRTINIT